MGLGLKLGVRVRVPGLGLYSNEYLSPWLTVSNWTICGRGFHRGEGEGGGTSEQEIHRVYVTFNTGNGITAVGVNFKS